MTQLYTEMKKMEEIIHDFEKSLEISSIFVYGKSNMKSYEGEFYNEKT